MNSQELIQQASLLLTEIRILVVADSRNGISNVDAIQISMEAFNMLKDKALIEPDGYQQNVWVATARGKNIAAAICPECFAPMGSGVGLREWASGRVFAIQCRKCHSCGFSEGPGIQNEANELPQPTRKFGRGEVAA